jgi:hypothetical protein
MNAVMLVAWSLLCVAATAGLMFFIMQSHMELRLAKQREELASLQATLEARTQALESSLKNAEDSIRRQAMDEFLADIRIEERHYTREHKVLFMSRKMLVRQERIFFRNIPLSNWVEHEMPVEEGVDTDKMAQTMSIFANAALFGDVTEQTARKLMR